ncbi:hypothetical protein CPB83DRAFT_799685 [Crepidotus variabilis]|uniref:FAD/NAD(P)-binding domain-containing protein n=1 Tax=Crepidotus variabilis TaxID=179855 RepID=A0A9P6JJC9_9AGAR|nr:hypothetical protein CPB83DRAFT_799685 [Crepidotus variabilis]
MQPSSVFGEAIIIVGTGAAGLMTAHTLLKDGFTNVTLITRDKSVGGTWAKQRVYPGLYINNVHGEYRFSDLAMPQPIGSSELGGRLSGIDMCRYMENFSRTFLEGKARILVETEVLNIQHIKGSGWEVQTNSVNSDACFSSLQTMRCAKLVLATGGCSNPRIPPQLSNDSAGRANFKGIVVHSSAFATEIDNILTLTNPTARESSKGPMTEVLVIGGGKSSRDIAAKLAQISRRVVVVYDKADPFLAYRKPLPDVIRKSRVLGLLSGHRVLTSGLERFLHQTWIGSRITSWLWRQISNHSFDTFNIPHGSPLRRTHSLFWNIRTSDEGNFRPDNYFALVQTGAIDVVSGTRAMGYTDDGTSVLLSNGDKIACKVVVLATGYSSSWDKIIQPQVASEIGLHPHVPRTKFNDKEWDYYTLAEPPAGDPSNRNWSSSIYRGLVPAKSIGDRDIAIMGSLFTENPGYTFEVCAHWVASYFRGDRMRLPRSVDEAIAECEIQSAWMRARYPNSISWSNESYSGSYDFWSWPQAVDELLEDMYLPSCRSGGNWLTWAFQVIDLKEISTLTEERQVKRDRNAGECFDVL